MFPLFPRGLFPPFWASVGLLLQHTPVHCSAIKQSVPPAKLGEHQKAPLRHSFERHLICGGNLSHKQPRGDFNIYSAVCSAYVSFGKQLTLAHYTQMKADLQAGQRPHSLCGEVSPSYEAVALSSPCSAHAYWTASRARCKREGPGWHDVYCTSIWSWCILRCKQGFKLYAPPCQWLRVTLAICLSAGGWAERGAGAQAGVCSRARVSACARGCAHACIYLLEPHVRFLFLLVPVSPPRCMANSRSWVPSQRRDSSLMINADVALLRVKRKANLHILHTQPVDKGRWYILLWVWVIPLMGTYLFLPVHLWFCYRCWREESRDSPETHQA